MDRIARLLALNPEFAEAFRRNEPWAVEHLQQVSEIDHPTVRFPERLRSNEGEKRNWCGSCPFSDGCMKCDLPYNPEMKELIGLISYYDLRCPVCGYKDGPVEATSTDEAAANWLANHLHTRRSPDCTATKLVAVVVKV